jgi:hypothetical protein
MTTDSDPGGLGLDSGIENVEFKVTVGANQERSCGRNCGRPRSTATAQGVFLRHPETRALRRGSRAARPGDARRSRRARVRLSRPTEAPTPQASQNTLPGPRARRVPAQSGDSSTPTRGSEIASAAILLWKRERVHRLDASTRHCPFLISPRSPPRRGERDAWKRSVSSAATSSPDMATAADSPCRERSSLLVLVGCSMASPRGSKI